MNKENIISSDSTAFLFSEELLSNELIENLLSFLRKGFSDRAKDVSVDKRDRLIIVSVLFNEENAFKTIERNKERDCNSFKEIWGEFSERRRFKDGSIEDIVVFEKCNKTDIVWNVFDYLLIRWLQRNNLSMIKKLNQISFKEWNKEPKNVWKTFEKIKSWLLNIDLVLRIKKIQPYSSSLRGTSIEKGSVYSFLIYIEDSNKWPVSPEAFIAAKNLFLLKISSNLKKFSVESSIVEEDILEILYEDCLFRGILSFKNLFNKSKTQKHVQHLVKLDFFLRNIQKKYFLFSSCSLLIKRWFSRQGVLFFHFSEELVECLAAYLFIIFSPQTLTRFFICFLEMMQVFSDEVVNEALKKCKSLDPILEDAFVCHNCFVPEQRVIRGLQMHARYLLTEFELCLKDGNIPEESFFFCSSKNGIELTIHLPIEAFRYQKTLSKNKQKEIERSMRGFNLNKAFVKYLIFKYENSAIFYFDVLNGNISLSWRTKKNTRVFNEIKKLVDVQGVLYEREEQYRSI